MRLAAVIAATAAALALASGAGASQLIDRNARGVRLEVDARGEALISYAAAGRVRHVLAWGAVNARQPTSGLRQVRFALDYAGGWGKYRRPYWSTFRNACRTYTGPALAFLVTACDAPDGSHWALQSWQTPLPDLGITPWLPAQRAWELHLSHWSGPVAKLEAWTNWIYGGRFHNVFGRMTYQGKPVYGVKSTRHGAPTDSYGRLVYLDTYDSVYGHGWRRENAFLLHHPTGIFCYGFYPFDPMRYPHPDGYPHKLRGPGNGRRYRITVEGPGVTPDVSVVVPGLHDFERDNAADVAYENQQNAILDSILNGDKACRQH
jgi:hypothetical protein